MNFIGKLFSQNKIECPRCLGKGEVDWDDIKRLNRELKWLPGKCAYCNGTGKIKSGFEKKVSVDATYFSLDLTKAERNRIINKDKGALLRGVEFERSMDNFINQVVYLNQKSNLTREEIIEFYLISENETSNEEKDDLVDYIKRIIESDDNKTS